MNPKKIAVLIVLFFNGTMLLGQTEFTYFQNIMFNDSSSFITTVAKPIGKETISLGIYLNEESRFLYATRMDEYGQTKWIKDLDSNVGVPITGMQALLLNDGNIVMAYIKNKETSNYVDIGLIKLNLEGEVLWKKVFADSTSKGIRQIIELSNGDLLMTGAQYIIDDFAAFYILKINATGKMIWEKRMTFGIESNGFTIQPTPDGQFILGGYSYHENTSYDMQIAKIDINGNLVWEKKYGGIEGDCAALMNVLTTQEEYDAGQAIEYLLSGCWEEEDRNKMYLAKLDDKGEIIWDRITDPFEDNIFHSLVRSLQTVPIIKKDKGFIGATFYDRWIGSYKVIVPLIVDFDAEGNINWTKELKPDTLDFGKREVQMYIRDMEPTPDGGYLIAGFQYIPQPQKSWVAKIDSLGNTCFPANCDSTIILTDIPELSQNNIHFSISPNPASHQVEITYQIPKDGILKVYDYQGRLMDNWELRMNNSSLTLEVGEWASGIYLYSVEIEGKRWASGKLVVE